MERDDLDRLLEHFTRRGFTRIVSALARTTRSEDLGVAPIAILQLVDETPRRLSELQDELTLTQPTTSRLVDDLVRRKLLHRAEDPDDRRTKCVEITAAGRKLVARIGAGRVAAMKAFMGSLTDEEKERARGVMLALLGGSR